MSSGNSMRVFVVDDSPHIRERLISMLADIEGLEIVGQADNGAAAIEGVRALSPDLVVLDIQLPGVNGIDVLRFVKGDYPAMKVIMLTNYTDAQYRDRCRDLRADYFLSKSTDAKLLVEIGTMLATQRDGNP